MVSQLERRMIEGTSSATWAAGSRGASQRACACPCRRSGSSGPRRRSRLSPSFLKARPGGRRELPRGSTIDAVFGPWFGGESWTAWRTVEAAIFGLPVPDLEPLFRELTGRDAPPDRPASEAWIIAGRRSAKSRKAATIATYLARSAPRCRAIGSDLAPGERGVVLVMAVDKAQAKVTLDYAKALFREIPMFAAMVERDTGEGLELNNRMSLMVVANDFRSIRGRTLVAAILDEVSYWRNELTANPDLEVYRAMKPALASMPGCLLIGIVAVPAGWLAVEEVQEALGQAGRRAGGSGADGAAQPGDRPGDDC